ncbi:MAG: ATP-binding protein [Nocardioides sp.]
MRTLRARTTALVVLVTGLTLAAGGWALVLTLQARITASNDRVDRAQLRELVASAQDGRLAATITDVGEEGVAQVVDARGRVLARSSNIRDADRIGPEAPGPRPVVATVDAPDDQEIERYRLWAVSAPTPDGPVTAYVGTSEESVHEASRTLTGTLLIGIPLVTALLGLATWLILGRALRRVDAIRSEVDSITESELYRRVPTSPVDDEVGRLATTMNGMLARLETSSARQRDFVADASHDLQGPLAAQRAQLEVALASSDGVDVPMLARDLLAGTSDMERLVRDLLFLATDDSGAPPPAPVPLDLDVILLEEVARLRPATGVHLDTAGVSAAPVRGDAGELRRLVRNLLENAARYAASTVRVTAAVDGDRVRVEVADDGPGVPGEDADLIFERFHRGDAARTRDDGGSGLGLAIARTVARRHGGELTLDPVSDGARFVLLLPLGA